MSAAKVLLDALLILPDRGSEQHGALLCETLQDVVTTGVQAAQMQGAMRRRDASAEQGRAWPRGLRRRRTPACATTNRDCAR